MHNLWSSRQLCCNLRVHTLSLVWTFSYLNKVYLFCSIPWYVRKLHAHSLLTLVYCVDLFPSSSHWQHRSVTFHKGQTCQSTIPISWNGSSLRDKPLRTLKDECMTPSLGWPDLFKLVFIEIESHTVIGNIPIHLVGTQFVTWIGFD